MTPQNALTKKTSPFRYGFAMFGTSIPINMFKSFAAIYYVDTLGLDMQKYALIPLIYAFVDAIDNPVYGFLSALLFLSCSLSCFTMYRDSYSRIKACSLSICFLCTSSPELLTHL